jgi:hypothetical protein
MKIRMSPGYLMVARILPAVSNIEKREQYLESKQKEKEKVKVRKRKSKQEPFWKR